MILMKFGGSSLSSPERIREIAAIVQNNLVERPALVLSAMGNTTNLLIAAGEAALRQEEAVHTIIAFHRHLISALGLEEGLLDPLFFECQSLLKGISLIQELTPKTRDLLLSFGERFSVRIFSAYLNSVGIAAAPYDGWDAGMLTSSDFSNAEVLSETFANAAAIFEGEQRIPVITGFIGKDRQGNITTLGRGGSDLTASIIGCALGVREIQLWKDVYGILTADPRLVAQARPVASLSFAEAAELAYFGAKVLHPSSILPAMSQGIAVRVKNHRDPAHPGTLVFNTGEDEGAGVIAMAHKTGQILVHIASTRMLGQWGFLATVFQIFADLKLSVDVIATSEVSLSLTLSQHDGLRLLQERLGAIATVKIETEKAMVSLIGKTNRSMERLEKAIRVLNEHRIDVQMISHGASKMNTSLVVREEDLSRCVEGLYSCFFNERGMG